MVVLALACNAAAKSDARLFRSLRQHRLSFNTPAGVAPKPTYYKESRPVFAVVGDRRQPLESSSEAEAIVQNSPYNGKTAIIVGAGPGGSLTGLLLAMRGFNVKIFEKRGHPNSIPTGSQRSIPNLLNPEVTGLLVKLGAKVATSELEEGLPAFSSILQTQPGSNQLKAMPPRKEVPSRILAERHEIAYHVVSTAMLAGFPNLEYIFDAECQNVDLSSKVATFHTQSGTTQDVEYDLLVGADGVRSVVRDALQAWGHLRVTQRSTTRTTFSIRDLPVPKDSLSRKFLDQVTFGSLAFGDVKVIGDIPMRIVVYRTRSGYQCLISVYKAGFAEVIEGKELEVISDIAPEWFPKYIDRSWKGMVCRIRLLEPELQSRCACCIPPTHRIYEAKENIIPSRFWKLLDSTAAKKLHSNKWIELAAKQVANGRSVTIGPVTYCSSFIGPNIALVGDACHSATPTLAIGSNRAILDARDLDDAMAVANGDVSLALRIYNEKAWPQVTAVQQLELFHPDSCITGPRSLWAAFYQPHVEFHIWGRKHLPGIVPPSVFVQLMNSTITPQEALRRYQLFAVSLTVASFSMLGGILLLLLSMSL